MFTHVIILNKSPFFIYAKDEEDAIRAADLVKGSLVGIAFAKGAPIEVLKPQTQITTLRPVEIKQITHQPEEVEVDEDELEKALNEEESKDGKASE